MIEVPRDLGMIPVGVLWEVIRSCDCDGIGGLVSGVVGEQQAKAVV